MIKSIAAAALLLSACADPNAAARAATRERLQRVYELEAREREQAYHAVRDAAREHLAAFQQEPSTPCTSANLAQASAEAVAAEEPAVAAYQNAIYEVAVLILDVADAAADADCPEHARPLYREVIRTFVGSGYTAYRQRAEIGLAELREG